MPVFQRVTHYFVQNEDSKICLEKFVFRKETNKISVVGDPRVDRVVAIAKESQQFEKIKAFCAKNEVLIAGSTWEKDDILLQQLIEQKKDWKFIIASHDIKESRLQFIENQYNRGEVLRFSQMPNSLNFSEKILLIDNIGMLSSIYKYGKIAYIGGGFGAGIHNTLEPMAFCLPIIFGPKYDKFEEANEMIKQKAAFSVQNSKELFEVFEQLENATFLAKAKQTINQYMFENQGATEKIFEFIIEKCF